MRISDWSSDVCSSDLVAVIGATVYDLEMKPIGAEWLKPEVQPPMDRLKPLAAREGGARRNVVQFGWSPPAGPGQTVVAPVGRFRPARPAERRVGEEVGRAGSSRWWPEHYKKKN